MEPSQIITLFKEIGLPAALLAITVELIKTSIAAKQRRSKTAILDWLGTSMPRDPFKDDKLALQVIDELQENLTFEKIFGASLSKHERERLLKYHTSSNDQADLKDTLDISIAIARTSGYDNIPHIKKFATLLDYATIICNIILIAALTSSIYIIPSTNHNPAPLLYLSIVIIATMFFYSFAISKFTKSLRNYAKLLEWEKSHQDQDA